MWDSGNCQSSVWQVISGVIKSYQCCVVQLVQRISYYWLLAPSWKTKSLSCRCSVCRWIFLALKYFDRYFLYRFWCRRTDERSNEPTSVCSSSASRNIYAAWKPLGCVCVCVTFLGLLWLYCMLPWILEWNRWPYLPKPARRPALSHYRHTAQDVTCHTNDFHVRILEPARFLIMMTNLVVDWRKCRLRTYTTRLWRKSVIRILFPDENHQF